MMTQKRCYYYLLMQKNQINTDDSIQIVNRKK